MTVDYRPITASDLDIICQHREAMFREMGREEDLLASVRVPYRNWLIPRLADGVYSGFIGEVDGNPVAGVGMTIVDWAPHPRHPITSDRGYISNLYVEPEFRRRGIANALMAMVEADMKNRNLELAVLHASEAGRTLYEKAGWVQGSEMFKALS